MACLNCTRGHLATAQTALAQAREAVARGDHETARAHWVVAAAEIDAMVALDWAPEKLVATPADDRIIIDAIRPCVEQVRQALPTPPSVATALGAAVVAKRFTNAPRVTARDRAEMAARLQLIDAQGNYAERVLLVTATDPAAQQAAAALRAGRHVLDRAHMAGAWDQPETWGAAAQHFQQAATALTPVPDPEQAQAVATTCAACTADFYGAVPGVAPGPATRPARLANKTEPSVSRSSEDSLYDGVRRRSGPPSASEGKRPKSRPFFIHLF